MYVSTRAPTPPHAIVYNGKSRFSCMPTCQILKVILINKCFRIQLSHICCKLQYKAGICKIKGTTRVHKIQWNQYARSIFLRSSSHYKHSLLNTPLNQNQTFQCIPLFTQLKVLENHMHEASDLHQTSIFNTVLIFRNPCKRFIFSLFFFAPA